MAPKFDPSASIDVFVRVLGGEVGAASSLAPKIGAPPPPRHRHASCWRAGLQVPWVCRPRRLERTSRRRQPRTGRACAWRWSWPCRTALPRCPSSPQRPRWSLRRWRSRRVTARRRADRQTLTWGTAAAAPAPPPRARSPSRLAAALRSHGRGRQDWRRVTQVKNIAHDGNLSLGDCIAIARIMRPRSMARELKGTVKEIVGTCQSVGCTIDGDSATDMLQKVWRAHSRSGLHALAWAGQAPERCICSAAWL